MLHACSNVRFQKINFTNVDIHILQLPTTDRETQILSATTCCRLSVVRQNSPSERWLNGGRLQKCLFFTRHFPKKALLECRHAHKACNLPQVTCVLSQAHRQAQEIIALTSNAGLVPLSLPLQRNWR